MGKIDLGKRGEKLAGEFIKKLGYRIIQFNYRFGHGEIDIVAKDKEVLVFIEVKYRSNLEYGDPILAVTKSKQRQIRKIAESYLYEKEIEEVECRIDVIGILELSNEEPKITHIINAF